MKIIGTIPAYHCSVEDAFIVEIKLSELSKLTEITDERRLRSGFEVDVAAIYQKLITLRTNEGLLKQYAEQLRGIATLLEPLSGHIKDACEGEGK